MNDTCLLRLNHCQGVSLALSQSLNLGCRHCKTPILLTQIKLSLMGYDFSSGWLAIRFLDVIPYKVDSIASADRSV